MVKHRGEKDCRAISTQSPAGYSRIRLISTNHHTDSNGESPGIHLWNGSPKQESDVSASSGALCAPDKPRTATPKRGVNTPNRTTAIPRKSKASEGQRTTKENLSMAHASSKSTTFGGHDVKEKESVRQSRLHRLRPRCNGKVIAPAGA